MGANATTFVPSYTSGEVLTAANLSVTNSGIPVFATTVTRDAAFGGTGEKTLAEGQFAYIEATNTTQYYDGAAWQSVGVAPGLVLISSTTIGTTVASVTVTGAFSATYDNYLIVVTGGATSTDSSLSLTLGATATGYYSSGITVDYTSTTVNGTAATNAANWLNLVRGSTNGLNGAITLNDPFNAKQTHFGSNGSRGTTTGNFNMLFGYLANSTSYTAFTLTTGTGTITGGTVRLYGYANS